MTLEYPAVFARFYDLIYHKIRDGVDNDFFLNEIHLTRGKILEIGVGTGRFFTEALKQGADIYGIDISKPMLEVLLAKLEDKQKTRVSQQNITDFHFDHKFNLIIAPFRVFMHLTSKEEQLKALNNVFKHLNPNGRFIFDVFIPDLRQLIQGLSDHTDFDEEYEPGKRIKRIATTHPELVNQLINITFRFEWDEANSQKQEEWNLSLRFFFRFELEHLLERSDFDSYAILGDYLGSPLSESSKEFILICQKKQE